MIGFYLFGRVTSRMMREVEWALVPLHRVGLRLRPENLNELYFLAKRSQASPETVAATIRWWMGGGGGSTPRACVELVRAEKGEVGRRLIELILHRGYERQLEPLMFALRLRVGAIEGERISGKYPPPYQFSFENW